MGRLKETGEEVIVSSTGCQSVSRCFLPKKWCYLLMFLLFACCCCCCRWWLVLFLFVVVAVVVVVEFPLVCGGLFPVRDCGTTGYI